MDDHWPNLYDDPYAVERVRRSVELLGAKPGHTVLDVGCNKKEALKFLPDGVEYVGIDGIQGDSIDGGFSLHRRFDRILCLETLEHLQWPRKTLASICEHLKEDGIAVISLPNESTLFHRIRSLLGTPDAEAFSECGKHLHLPNLKQAKSVLLEGNLDILLQRQYVSMASSSRQSWIGLAMRLFPKFLWKWLADSCPSLYARGFIFVCKKKLMLNN